MSVLPESMPPAGFGPHWLVRLGLRGDGQVVTFYSYKGGTGRSMALVNCAGLIARHLPVEAKPLLLIDFDLEAPGLHRYLAPYLGTEATGVGRPGVLELFASLNAAVDMALCDIAPTFDEVPRIADDQAAAIVDAIVLEDFIDVTVLSGLKLMTAGRFDDSYDRRATRFDWEGLHAKAPALFRCLAERLAREHSFVFVDSRTGLCDTSNICTMLLPDVLVMVFTPNQQSLTGIEHLVRKVVDYRNGSTDSRAISIYPLPSRVDNQVEHFRQVWRMGTLSHELFGPVTGYQLIFESLFVSLFDMAGAEAKVRVNEYFDVVQVPHSADYSYGERLCFTSDAPSDSLSIRGAYEQFLPWLVTTAAPWQRPVEMLLGQQAAAWLHDAGVDAVAVEDDETWWDAWFERLANAVQALPNTTLLRLASEPQHGFDVSTAAALGMASSGELASSLAFLKQASHHFDDDLTSMLPDKAPAMLLRRWNRLTPAELVKVDHKVWLQAFETLLRRWQPLKSQRLRWLSALADLAHKGVWLDIEKRILTELVDLSEQTSETQLLQKLDAQSRLAQSLYATGSYSEARYINNQVLEARRQMLGEEHPDTLASMSNLAETLRAQGNIASAREIEETTLSVRRRLLGKDHPNTLASMNNLAETLLAQGNLAEARKLHEIALSVRRRVLGQEHLDTLVSMNNLAVTLHAQGDLVRAREFHEAALSVRCQVLGQDHPDTLTSMNNLAGTLWAQGDFTGARGLQETALSVCRRVLGENHPNTLTVMNNLAETLQAQGDLAGARGLHETVLPVRRRVLGDEHPDTVGSMNNLAETLRVQGDLAGARRLHETALSICRRVLGEEHPRTLTAMINLTGILRAQNDLVGARKLQEIALSVCRRVLGDEHPDTLTAMNNLAWTLQTQGDLTAAHKLQETVLSVRRRVLGEEHPDTLTAMANFAWMLWAQGDLVSARELEEAILSIRHRILGEEHPATLIAMDSLAWTLQAQGDLAGAHSLLETVLSVRRRMLGVSHPLTLQATQNLANLLQQTGDLTSALALYETAVEALSALPEPDVQRMTSLNMALATVALELGQPQRAAEVLDRFTNPVHTTADPNWRSLRLRVAERLGDHQTVRRLEHSQYGLLKLPDSR